MGRKFAFFSVLAFLTEGAAGLPVFASAVGGAHHLIGPTGGYLIGYLIVSYVVGGISDRMKTVTFTKALVACLTGSAIILFCGWAWLSVLVGAKSAWMFGVYPFILSDAAKTVIVTLTVPVTRSLHSWINK